MKKNILSILFIFVVISLTAAKAKKLVLLGESRTVNILTVKLSDREDFELFERSQVEQILREHQLSSYGLSPDKIIKHFSHANLIVIISQAGEKKATYPSRITVFNAQNGYKLANTALPPTPFEAAKKAVEIIDMANAKAAKASLLLSIGIIRNAGVSDKLKYRIAEIIFALSEALVNSDKAQMLERDYLGAVLNERELSGTTHTLKTSSRMINLEFLPGANGGQIDVVLRLTNPAGKVFFSKKYLAVQKTDKMIRDVCKILKTTPAKTISNNKEEAKRYYNEFKSFFRLFSKYSNALPKNHASVAPLLHTMIALDPQNPRYRYEKIFYELCLIHDRRNSKQKLAILRRYIKDANEFIDKFPDYKYHRNSGGFRNNDPNPVSPLSNFNDYFSDDDQVELTDLIIQIKKIDQRNKRGNDPHYLDDKNKIKTLMDLMKYRGTVMMEFGNIPNNDAVQLVRQNYKNDIEIIRIIKAFIKKHPELEKKARRHYGVCFPYGLRLPKYRQKEAWEEIKKILNRDFDKLKKLYISTGQAQVISRLNELQVIRDYLNSDGSKIAFKKNLDAALEGAKLKKIMHGSMYFSHLRDAGVARGLSQRWIFKVCTSRPAIYFAEKGKTAGLSEQERNMLLVREWMAGKIPSETILKNAASIRKLAYIGICKNSVVHFLARLRSYLYRDTGDKAQRRKILKTLNNNFTIEILKVPFKYTLDAIAHGSKVYLLQSSKGRKLELCEYDLKTSKISRLNIPDIALNDFQRQQKNFGQSNSSTISISANHIFIGGENNMLVYDLTNGKSTWLKDLSGKYIASVTAYKDRIYYLCGTKGFPNSPSLFSMHSCKFDGTDRKTLFSSQRLNKEHELDHITSAMVSTFVALPDGNSLFAVSKMSGIGKIYRFNPKDESFSLISNPKKEYIVNLFDHGDFILGQEGRIFGESYFLMDKRKLRREYFFTQNIRDKRRPYKYRIPGYSSVKDAVRLFKNRYLVYGSGANGCGFLDLHDLKNSPMLLLDGVNNMLYLSLAEKFIFTTRSKGVLYIVKLKRSTK